MRVSWEAHDSLLNEAPIAAYREIETVERYYAPSGLRYKRIRAEMKVQTSDEEYPGLTLYAINGTFRPKGLFSE